MLRGPLTPRSRIAALLVAGAVAVVGPGTHDLSAQTVILRPHAGLNLPTRFSLRNGMLQVRQKIGLTVGARLTLRFNPRFDVTTGVSYSPGYAVIRGAGERIEVGAGSHALSATTGARYWLLPPPRQFSWEVHTGLGVAFGGQSSYADLFESSTVNAVVGTALSYRIGRLVTLKLRVQERLYRVRFGDHPPGRSRSPLQVAFGLGFPFLESAR